MILYSQFQSLWFIFLLAAPLITAAQSSSSNNSSQQDDSIDSSTMAILVLVVLSALLFLGSFSLWIQNCCDYAIPYNRSPSFRSVMFVGGSRSRQTGHNRHSPTGSTTGGVDKSLIDSFPTIVFSLAKEMKIGVETLECAVCLSEFSGEEVLRLLPSCDHVFHPNCIAAWLANHVTCPVCRANVVDNRRTPMKMEAIIPIATPIEQEDLSPCKARSEEQNSASVSESRRDCERFTLKLPDGVKEQIVKAGLKLKMKRSASCEHLPGECSGSQISRWIGRSERWGSSVVPSDCLAVKGDGTGDKLGMLPV